MAWRAHWTQGAWLDIGGRNPDLVDRLMRAVREFAATGSGKFIPDGVGLAMGRLVVGNYRIRLARMESRTSHNDDGEEVTITDAIVVLGVSSIDPEE
jgi:hypothetical protein